MEGKAEAPAKSGAQTDVVVWDFASSKRLQEQHLSIIERSHGEFAKQLNVTLAGLLGEYVEVEIADATEVLWDKLTSEIPSPCAVFTFTASPLEGTGILNIDLGFAFAIVDKLLGGSGKPLEVARGLTPIEQRLLTRFVEKVVKAMAAAWRGHANLNFTSGDYISTPDLVPSLGINDSAIRVAVSMRLGSLNGSLVIGYPYLMLEPIIKAFAKTQPGRKTTGDRARMEAFLKRVGLPVTVRLTPSMISMKHLLSLEPGDVLLLDNRVSDEVEVAIADEVLYMGRPGSSEGRIAVKITRAVKGGMTDGSN